MSNAGLIKNYIAEAAVLPYRVVKFGSADGQVLQAAAATDASFGVSDNLGQATAGSRVDVIHTGIAEAEAGATFTRGALLSADAQGRVVAAAAAGGSNVRVIGVALVSATAVGEIVSVAVEPGSFQG